jgi:hypothetical protein
LPFSLPILWSKMWPVVTWPRTSPMDGHVTRSRDGHVTVTWPDPWSRDLQIKSAKPSRTGFHMWYSVVLAPLRYTSPTLRGTRFAKTTLNRSARGM